jgi:hypothetical protein
MSNSLKDMLSPEMRNIMERYHRLGLLCENMGLKNVNSNNPISVLKEIEKHKGHKDYEEIKNLCKKLTKIERK